MKVITTYLFALLFFCMIYAPIDAQIRIGKDKKSATQLLYKDAAALKKTTLMVATYDEKSEATLKLTESIKKYWKFTSFQFINVGEVEKYIKDPKYSVLFLAKFGLGDDVSGYGYGIALGDKKNKTVSDAELITYMRLPDVTTEEDEVLMLNFEYLIPFFVKALQQDVVDGYEKKVHKTYSYKNAYYFDDGVNEIKNNKVLISKNALNPDFKKKNFLNNFGLKEEQVFIVGNDEIKEAIEKEDENVVFIYDFTGKLGTIYSIKGSHGIAFGSDYNMNVNKVYLYSASAVGLGAFIYIVKTKMNLGD